MTLKEIEKNFSLWRKRRRHPKEKIPAELWQQVAKIYPLYTPLALCQALGLTRNQLKNAMRGDGFATFKPTAMTSDVLSQASVCEVILEHRNTRLTIKAPLAALDSIVSKFAEHMPC
jgi:hypothetical protein